jgi:hypothetical protein
MTAPKRPIPEAFDYAAERGLDEPLVFDDEGTVIPRPRYRGDWAGVEYMTAEERATIDRLFPRPRRRDRIFGVIAWAVLTFALAYFIAHVLVAAGVGR